jgi:hypothetical protein
MKLARFVVGAITSAAIWVGTWIGTGYVVGGAIRDGGGSGVTLLAAIVEAVALALLSVVFRPAILTTAMVWLSQRCGERAPVTKARPADADIAAGRPAGSREAGGGGAVMDMNEYALEVLARERMGELRAEANRSHQRRALRPPSRPLRIVLGRALIRMGRRLQGLRRPSLPDRRAWPGGPGFHRPERHGRMRPAQTGRKAS